MPLRDRKKQRPALDCNSPKTSRITLRRAGEGDVDRPISHRRVYCEGLQLAKLKRHFRMGSTKIPDCGRQNAAAACREQIADRQISYFAAGGAPHYPGGVVGLLERRPRLVEKPFAGRCKNHGGLGLARKKPGAED